MCLICLREGISLQHRERVVRAFEDDNEDYLLVTDTLGVNSQLQEELSPGTFGQEELQKDYAAAETVLELMTR